MSDPSAEARIRDLERRLDMDPGSRLFVSLAEEYRKLGRFKQALSALQKGLLAHPGYVAAQVALGRVYVEASQPTDAIATFTKVLVADPGNLVAARSLADVYMARGDKLEALKKYKLYRALSGDRKVDEMIVGLEGEVAPRPVTPSRVVAKPEPPPPPPSFQETDKSKRRPPLERPKGPRLSDAFDITSVAFEPGEDSHPSEGDDPFPFVPTRDTALTPVVPVKAPAPSPAPPSEPVPAPAPVSVAPPTDPAPAVTESARPQEETTAAIPSMPQLGAAELEPESAREPESEPAREAVVSTSAAAEPLEDSTERTAPGLFRPPDDSAFGEVPKLFQESEETLSIERPSREAPPLPAPDGSLQAPTGRALADLYYSQGHYAEALQIYDDLVGRHPFDDDLMRMRRDAEARLLPAGKAAGGAVADPGVDRRRARIRALERWLSAVQAG